MQIRPHNTLIFLLAVFTVLLVISLYPVFDADAGIKITGNFSLKFFSIKDAFGKQDNYADISGILLQNQMTGDSALVAGNPATGINGNDTIRANADSLKSSIQKIEFPDGDNSVLHPVFEAMETAVSSGKVVRIMHYGDSQIENDRITSLLRTRLQGKFGGCGVGLIPARQLFDNRFSIIQKASDNWQRYTVYGARDTTVNHNRFGILAGFCSFTPAGNNEFHADNAAQKAWISFDESPYGYSNTKKFEQCRLFYGYNTDTFLTRMLAFNTVINEVSYPPADGLRHMQWLFKETPKSLTIEMEGTHSPEVYAIALDGLNGIAVDNIAMRGCSGLIFNKMNAYLFSQMVNALNPRLLILQYGGNVVPNIRESYKYYENWFYSQLQFIQTNAPDVRIIVIGVSDMSIKKGDSYESYPNIEMIRDALKNAAFRANAGFWDMYQAMGGKNSMPSWVFAKPPLAGNDFVHFNPRGANIIANMFYNAFMYEYSLYKNKSTSGKI